MHLGKTDMIDQECDHEEDLLLWPTKCALWPETIGTQITLTGEATCKGGNNPKCSALWTQCGGSPFGWPPNCCQDGGYCTFVPWKRQGKPHYMECAPATYFAAPRHPRPKTPPMLLKSPAAADRIRLKRLRGEAIEQKMLACESPQAMWAQCGGQAYDGEHDCCVPAAACVPLNKKFSICLPK